MKYTKILSLFILLLSLTGCSSRVQEVQVYFDDETFIDSYKIFDAKSLSANHKILIIPFKAGDGIEANEALDSVSLMLIKGVHDALKEGQSAHSVLSSSNSNQAELIMRGYIIKMQTPAGLGRQWLSKRKEYVLRVEASLIDKKSGLTIAVFKHERESQDKKQNLKYLGHLIGQDIGQIVIQEGQR